MTDDNAAMIMVGWMDKNGDLTDKGCIMLALIGLSIAASIVKTVLEVVKK